MVLEDGKIVDRFVTPFGIREVKWDPGKGLLVNGKTALMKGVCLHHDLGALGAAFNERAMERRLDALKYIGCNAIRTSHNPPAPQLLEMCDIMGFLVIDEAVMSEFDFVTLQDGFRGAASALFLQNRSSL
jgi:beta-galactosidase